jgi:hypothetical protein
MPPKPEITDDRKIPEKIKFILDNHAVYTRGQLAELVHEARWWVKRQVYFLIKTGQLQRKRLSSPRKITEADWTDELKYRAIELRHNFLRSNKQICTVLKKEFGFEIKTGTLQLWLSRFKCPARTKQEWLNEYLPKELAKKLLDDSYKIIDISKYLKNVHDVYVSDDLILVHIQKLGLLSFKLKKLEDIRLKSNEFTKEWLLKKIKGHAGLKGLTQEMGASKTIVMKRIKEEGLSLIKHRKIWSKNLEILREQLLELTDVEIIPEDFHQMILGWLIGDGHIDSNGRLAITHSINQLDHLYLKIRVLKKYISNIVTIPNEGGIDANFFGGKEQIGISCPGLSDYTKYMNPDGSKNYEMLISELSPIGWACYFMDDGSILGSSQVMTINNKFLLQFENRFLFKEKIRNGILKIEGINPEYIIPGFAYKFQSPENLGSFWRPIIPEMFEPTINKDIDLCLIKPYLTGKNDNLLKRAADYYQKKGFPFFSVSDDYLNKAYESLRLINPDHFWKNEKTFKFNTVGDLIFKHFMPQMVDAKYRNISAMETFNNRTLFHQVLEYSLKQDKTILPSVIYDHLIYFNGTIFEFPCPLAKALVQRMTNENDIIVDPCSGWGSRLLGTATADRTYIGFEPIQKTAIGLNNIIHFFKINNATIINQKFNPDSAPPNCHMVFTSPPYNMNRKEWSNLITRIFDYAEKALHPQGSLILNIDRSLKSLLPKTTLKELSPLFCCTTTRQKNIDSAEILYHWIK